MIARVAVWEPMPTDDRDWVLQAAAAVPGVHGAYHLIDPANPAYGLAACLAFRPHLNADSLDQTMQSLVLRHENLRFAFPSDGIGPVPTLLRWIHF